jgi:hypothetical protein
MPSPVQCGQCKADLPDEPPDTPPDNRQPCPKCGSVKRDFRMVANSGTIAVTTGAVVMGGGGTAITRGGASDLMEEHRRVMDDILGPDRPPADPPSINIVVDSEVDQDLLAEFLAELSGIYSELSGGDELIIVEGKLPVAEEACV